MLPGTNHALRARAVLTRFWGYEAFRPLQEEIIVSVLEGRDTLALLPTGGGKSICYQVPALCQEGLCLVISPLIALMKDQVEQLRKKNITAYAIVSGMSRKEVINILQVAGSSNCRFLYVSPERLETQLFKEYLPSLGIKLIAVDEAHCISQWGYDFRPPYLRIAALREELPHVPVLALTASATPKVQEDIQKRLQFTQAAVFRQSFARPNLSYSAFLTDSKINRILDILNKVPGSSLIYCRSRRRTKEISDLLQLHGIAADFYHAGLSQEERNTKQENWISNKVRTMACTNAFGMGIDKPDVKLVIHADVPECLENYYQEAGRAGRDGQRAFAVLLYQEKDLTELREAIEMRFPDFKQIRTIYQSLMNFLQLPSGSGEGQSLDFDFPEFLQRFSLEAAPTMAVIKTLEQEGHFSFNELIFTPSRLQFICDKGTLYRFEEERPELEPLIKTLLRNYEGIIDQPVAIQEKNLTYLLKCDSAELNRQLQELVAYRIIAWYPKKEKPQLYFLMNRVPAEQLRIDQQAYQERKKDFTARVEAFIRFIHETRTCRSKQIGSYFGDNSLDDCGCCDNCLERKKKPLDEKTFETILLQLRTVLNKEKLGIEEVVPKLNSLPEKKAWQVIEYLQAEEILLTDPSGKLYFR